MLASRTRACAAVLHRVVDAIASWKRKPTIHSVPVADPGTRKRGSTMSRLHRLGAVAFLLAVPFGATRAQTTGTISGQVTAAEGQPIVGAQVSVAGTTRGAN